MNKFTIKYGVPDGAIALYIDGDLTVTKDNIPVEISVYAHEAILAFMVDSELKEWDFDLCQPTKGFNFKKQVEDKLEENKIFAIDLLNQFLENYQLESGTIFYSRNKMDIKSDNGLHYCESNSRDIQAIIKYMFDMYSTTSLKFKNYKVIRQEN